MRYYLLFLMVVTISLHDLHSQSIQVTYYRYQNTYLKLDMYPYGEEQDSTEIEQYIAEYEDEVLGDLILDLSVTFPQIYGLQNKDLEAELNANFRRAIRHITQEQDMPMVLMSTFIDSGNTSYIPIDSAKLQTKRDFKRYALTDMNGQLTQSITLKMVDEFIQIRRFSGQDGNIGAHPNFSVNNTLILKKTGEDVTFKNLYEGNYMDEVYRAFDTYDLFNGERQEVYKENCLGGDIRKLWKESVSSETKISDVDDTYLILSKDLRDFGCPEIMRGIIEMKFSREKLAKYKKN